MSRTLSLFAIGLVFGGAIGFTIAAGNGITFDGHDHADPAHHGGMAHDADVHAMMHDTPLQISASEAPRLQIMVMPDPMSGWNVHLITERFTFSPQNASRDHVVGEGHAHIYLNGEKLNRVYSNWYHIDAMPDGENEVQVTLNANDHRVFEVDGAQITAIQTVTVQN